MKTLTFIIGLSLLSINAFSNENGEWKKAYVCDGGRLVVDVNTIKTIVHPNFPDKNISLYQVVIHDSHLINKLQTPFLNADADVYNDGHILVIHDLFQSSDIFDNGKPGAFEGLNSSFFLTLDANSSATLVEGRPETEPQINTLVHLGNCFKQ